MALDEAASEQQYVGDYSYVPGGITNQKQALLGLFVEAIENGPRRIMLPDLLVYNPKHNHAFIVHPSMLKSWAEYYDIDRILEFGKRHGVEVVHEPKIAGKFGWPFFDRGVKYICDAGLKNSLNRDHLACDFLRSLVPHLRTSSMVKSLKEVVFQELGIKVVAQLRIEEDWRTMTPGDSAESQRHFNLQGIIERIEREFSEKRIFACCDEGNLPASPKEIKDTIRDVMGVEVFFKSDFISQEYIVELNNLDLSIIDFELILGAQFFVGTSLSTFSSVATLERYAHGSYADNDYIYNVPGQRLGRRTDRGAFPTPEAAAREYYGERYHNFWLAQMWMVKSGSKQETLRLYRSRLELNDQDTEEYGISAYRVAELLVETGAPSSDIIQAFEHAIDVTPHRAEPLHGLSRYYRYCQMYSDGYAVAKRGLAVKRPEKGLFIEGWIYEYGLLDELAVNAYASGHYKECVIACASMLALESIPRSYVARVHSNGSLALQNLASALG